MKDKNGKDIEGGCEINVVGTFSGVVVGRTGYPKHPIDEAKQTFDGTEKITVVGTDEGILCKFEYNNRAFQLDFRDEGSVEIITPAPKRSYSKQDESYGKFYSQLSVKR